MTIRFGVIGLRRGASFVRVCNAAQGATVTAQRHVLDAQGKWSVVDSRVLGTTPLRGQMIVPGSYLLTVSLPGHRDVRLPTMVGHDEEIKQHVSLP